MKIKDLTSNLIIDLQHTATLSSKDTDDTINYAELLKKLDKDNMGSPLDTTTT